MEERKSQERFNVTSIILDFAFVAFAFMFNKS